MALWRDPLDELIADLERTLPSQPATDEPDHARQFIELQLMVSKIMRGPRTPLAPDPCDDQEAAGPRNGSKSTL